MMSTMFKYPGAFHKMKPLRDFFAAGVSFGFKL
jgi:hypothetical protein